jgi:hypothetical protein
MMSLFRMVFLGLGLLFHTQVLAAMPQAHPLVEPQVLSAQQGQVLLQRLHQQQLHGVSMYALLNSHSGWQRAKKNQVAWRIRMPAASVQLSLQTTAVAEVVEALNQMLMNAPKLTRVDYQQSKPMDASQFEVINGLLTSYDTFYTCDMVSEPCLAQLEIQYELDHAYLIVNLERGFTPRYVWMSNGR